MATNNAWEVCAVGKRVFWVSQGLVLGFGACMGACCAFQTTSCLPAERVCCWSENGVASFSFLCLVCGRRPGLLWVVAVRRSPVLASLYTCYNSYIMQQRVAGPDLPSGEQGTADAPLHKNQGCGSALPVSLNACVMQICRDVCELLRDSATTTALCARVLM
jgi:hypothetical protein